MTYDEKMASLRALGRVLGYVERRWYEMEYGKVEHADRWYDPASIFLQERYSILAKEQVL